MMSMCTPCILRGESKSGSGKEEGMSERKGSDPEVIPEDVATLYTWAHLQGAKYRDFSASREQARVRRRPLTEQELLAHKAVEETVRANAASGAAVAAEAIRPRREQAPPAGPLIHPVAPPALPSEADRRAAGPQRLPLPEEAVVPEEKTPPEALNTAPEAPVPAIAVPPSGRPDGPHLFRSPLTPRAEDFDISPDRPAWLQAQPAVAPRPEGETLQQSRERVASRWFALKSVFDPGAGEPEIEAGRAAEPRIPYLVVFSLAGGVGKTSLVATLGRTLSARGERVLLIDTAGYGLLPFYFGARELRPGVVRTFTPPGDSTEAPVHMVSLDGEPQEGAADTLAGDLDLFSRGSNRVVVDLTTASGGMLRRFLKLEPTLLIPVTPDMNSVVSLNALNAFLRRNTEAGRELPAPYFILNQFDAFLPLHLDVRELLRQQLGERLLPFALRRSPAVSEALAEGMTVVDYSPHSPTAEDFISLANWVRSVSQPAASSFRGARWSER